MAKLNIHVNDQGGKTVSKFGKTKNNDKIIFHNQHPTKTLDVSIRGEEGAGPALCKDSTPVAAFTVTPVEQKKAFRICEDYLGATFKYTATIDGSQTEDPIIIIEHSSIIADNLACGVIAATALVVGVTTGYTAASRRLRRMKESLPRQPAS